MLTLTDDERTWLDQYRQTVAARHPGKVVRMEVFGSKARGDGHAESDVDVLVVTNDDSVKLKLALERIGCELAMPSLVLPGIVVYTEAQWAELKRLGSGFHQNVEREAVSVL